MLKERLHHMTQHRPPNFTNPQPLNAPTSAHNCDIKRYAGRRNDGFSDAGEQALSEYMAQCPIRPRSPLDVPVCLWQNAAPKKTCVRNDREQQVNHSRWCWSQSAEPTTARKTLRRQLRSSSANTGSQLSIRYPRTYGVTHAPQ